MLPGPAWLSEGTQCRKPSECPLGVHSVPVTCLQAPVPGTGVGGVTDREPGVESRVKTASSPSSLLDVHAPPLLSPGHSLCVCPHLPVQWAPSVQPSFHLPCPSKLAFQDSARSGRESEQLCWLEECGVGPRGWWGQVSTWCAHVGAFPRQGCWWRVAVLPTGAVLRPADPSSTSGHWSSLPEQLVPEPSVSVKQGAAL